MLTPKFSLCQTDTTITVKIHASFARISDTEINIQENIFKFYSSPYYLSLHLPGKLIDSEADKHKVSFNAEDGSFNIECLKEVPGEYFFGLDMLTDLLTPKGCSSIHEPKIEVLDANGASGCSSLHIEDDDEIEFFFEQKIPSEEEERNLGYKYGFANSKNGVFTTLRSELNGVVDVSDPDNKSVSERRNERLNQEEASFDENHYLADLFDVDDQYLQFVPTFYEQSKKEVKFTSEEEERLLQLPRKELLIDKGCHTAIYLGLVDILLAWCYNHRITLGENCVESAWNVAKLSSTFSWLECFYDLKSVIVAFLRRSLVFPLVRNWSLSEEVIKDTITILSSGKVQILKCLLEIHKFFNNYDPYYLLNQLYLTEYCVWLQTVNEYKLESLANSIQKIALNKDMAGLELEELETAAQLVLEEEAEATEIKINPNAKEFNSQLNSPDDEAILQQMAQMSVIENKFALSKNDNEAEVEPTLGEVLCNGNEIMNQEVDSSDENSTDSEDDSSSDGSETEESTSDTSTLDSDDDSSSNDDK